MVDNAVWNSARWGDSTTSPPTVYARWNVRNQLFSSILKQFKGQGSCTVTRRKLALGAKDSTTGWYEKNWNEKEIEGVLVPRGTSNLVLPSGNYVRLQQLFKCADGLEEGDEIQANNVYYEVKGVEEHWLTIDNFSHRDCHLTELRMHDLSYINTSPSVNDARERTKTYWETYIDSSKLNNHNYTIHYANPEYPLIKVFKEKAIGIDFAISQPTSTPMMDPITKSPYGYEELVPTDVQALDTQLMHLGSAELRRIAEDNPEGSLRGMETMNPTTIRLGRHTVYSQRHILNYRRDTT